MTDGEVVDRIGYIKRRLEALDDSCGQPTTEGIAALERFETRAKVRLPDEYRAFLWSIRRLPTIIPFYGMVPPGHSADGISKPLPIEYLAQPFPFVEKWIWEDDPEIDLLAAEDWTLETRTKWDAREHGLLWLGTDGCALHPALVVTGEKRGEVWEFADVGLVRAEPGGGSFLDWLEHRIGQFPPDKDACRNKPRFPAPWWSYL